MILTDTDTRRYLFLLVSVLIGIIIGYLTLPYIADHNLLPKINKTQIEKESTYPGYGITEDHYYTTYKTKEDEKQDYKNMVTALSLQIIYGIASFLASCFVFAIIEILIYILRRSKNENNDAR